MTECQLDTFQRLNLIYAGHSVRRATVVEKIPVTFFLIFCATCLWDAVGHFLGCLKTPQACAFAGNFDDSRLIEARVNFIHFK